MKIMCSHTQAHNKAIKVTRYTRHFWFGVQCAWLVQSWHTLLRALNVGA